MKRCISPAHKFTFRRWRIGRCLQATLVLSFYTSASQHGGSPSSFRFFFYFVYVSRFFWVFCFPAHIAGSLEDYYTVEARKKKRIETKQNDDLTQGRHAFINPGAVSGGTTLTHQDDSRLAPAVFPFTYGIPGYTGREGRDENRGVLGVCFFFPVFCFLGLPFRLVFFSPSRLFCLRAFRCCCREETCSQTPRLFRLATRGRSVRVGARTEPTRTKTDAREGQHFWKRQ